MGRVAISWSGGKDCCMSLHKAVKAGHQVVCLLTTLPLQTQRTFGHGYKEHILRVQSEALDIPLNTVYTGDDYRESYLDALLRLKGELNIEGVVFGDLYLWEHRRWCESIAIEAGLDSYFPFWMEPHEAGKALLELIETGYSCKVIRVKKDVFSQDWLGKTIDYRFAELVPGNICPMGEAGEYHTLVTEGPLFKKTLEIGKSRIVEDEFTFILEIEDIGLKN